MNQEKRSKKSWAVLSNHIRDGKTLTGKLVFNEDAFCFKADSVNGALNCGYIGYDQIQSVQNKNLFGFLPSGLLVILNDGTELQYVPLKRRQVKEFLTNKIRK